jgi:hypothetical protein
MVGRGLDRTAHLWPPIEIAYGWVRAAAEILDNPKGFSGKRVQRRFIGLVGAMTRWQPHSDTLQDAVAHFLKVTHSYWSG